MLEAGLREKKISFSNIDCSPKEYHDKLCSVFPKLMEAGGFEFMRRCSNSRMLEPISSTAMQSPCATNDRVGRSKVYIRPVQKDLCTKPVNMQSPRATNDRVGRSKVYIRPVQKDICTKPVNGDSSTKTTVSSNLFAIHNYTKPVNMQSPPTVSSNLFAIHTFSAPLCVFVV